MGSLFDHWARDIEDFGEKPKLKSITNTPDHHFYAGIEVWTCPKCKIYLCEKDIDYSLTICTKCGWKLHWYNAMSVDKIKLNLI